MPRPLQDSVAVITGASSGIGRAVAIELARRGTHVVLVARREAALRAVARVCRRHGAKAMVVPTDVSDEQAVQRLARLTIQTFGGFDIWVNNAGVLMFGRFETVPSADFRRVIDVDLLGTLYGARAALRHFRRHDRGVLVNVSSVLGRIGHPLLSAYVASNFGILGLGESLRMETRDAPDIHICSIIAASIDTPMFQHAANFTGRAIRAPSPVYNPRMVAGLIADVCAHPQREVYAGAAGRCICDMRSLLPAVAERVFALKGESEVLDNQSAARTRGNLFQPADDALAVTGGWRAHADRTRDGDIRDGAGMKTVLAAAAAAVAAVSLHELNRKCGAPASAHSRASAPVPAASR